MHPTLELACELIRRRSVTPADEGCQNLLADRLDAWGCQVQHLPYGKVSNLWATHGKGAPLLVLMGHTDVVPPGPTTDWRHDPFLPELRDGWLSGRGASDMKGAVAAMVIAMGDFIKVHPAHAGTLALLLTSDEEGPAIDGTRRVVETLVEQEGILPNWCLVGEPTSGERLGDVVRNGRRGSLTGRLQICGIQGHVAHPQHALNPIHQALPALGELCAVEWDSGDKQFPPTSLQIANIHAGTGADNVIPGVLDVIFNLRHGPVAGSSANLRRRVEKLLDRYGLDYQLDWHPSAEPFYSPPGQLLEAVVAVLRTEAGIEPQLSTGGGTSDGRFLAPHSVEVVELGPASATAHQVNERVSADDLVLLARVYRQVIARLLDPRACA